MAVPRHTGAVPADLRVQRAAGFGLVLSGFSCTVLALSLGEGAYKAEIMRSGIRAVGFGQRQAARALGMREGQVMLWVVLTHALRISVPPIGNQFIGMLKLSALVSVIACRVVSAGRKPAGRRQLPLPGGAVRSRHLLPRPHHDLQGVAGAAAALPRCHGGCGAGAMSAPVLLEATAIHKAYGALAVLRGVDLSVRRGECHCIIGPSGSGKSTLLRCLNLLEPIQDGRILFEGQDIARTPRRQAPAVRQRIGMVFQNVELFQHLSALDNVALAPIRVRGEAKAAARDKAAALPLPQAVRLFARRPLRAGLGGVAGNEPVPRRGHSAGAGHVLPHSDHAAGVRCVHGRDQRIHRGDRLRLPGAGAGVAEAHPARWPRETDAGPARGAHGAPAGSNPMPAGWLRPCNTGLAPARRLVVNGAQTCRFPLAARTGTTTTTTTKGRPQPL